MATEEGEDEVVAEEDLVTVADLEDGEDSEVEEVDSGPQKVEDFGAEEVAEAPREEEEAEVAAEEALEEGRRS